MNSAIGQYQNKASLVRASGQGFQRIEDPPAGGSIPMASIERLQDPRKHGFDLTTTRPSRTPSRRADRGGGPRKISRPPTVCNARGFERTSGSWRLKATSEYGDRWRSLTRFPPMRR